MRVKNRFNSQYYSKRRLPRWARRIGIILLAIIVILIIGGVIAHHEYSQDLKPVDPNGRAQTVEIATGASAKKIAAQLASDHLIRSQWAFEFYLTQNGAYSDLKAGTYSLSPAMDVGEIVSILTHGKVATSLVTILPGKRLDQVKQELIDAGFKASDVSAALNPNNYQGNPALVDKPAGASLEGFLYPDSFAKVSTTQPQQIIEESLNEMASHLTPQLRAAFTKEGLNTYQGIILASIVDQEVPDQTDRAQVAQVFLSRLAAGMPLQSDQVTLYGDRLASQPYSMTYDTPYNVYLHKGLPPTPISNVDASSLYAAAHPAHTSWLYFVTGRDCKTHFATTLAEHQANIAQYGNGCQQ